jgi:glycerol-3-phosphate cytidylyltransferase
MPKEKVVITYGTFDLFHIGHLRLLERLKSLGDTLIVGVSTDQFNDLKGKETVVPFAQRFEIVKSIKWVDMVIEENSWEQKKSDIVGYGADIFGIGSDWQGEFDHLSELCEVVYLERTEGASSTQLKEQLQKSLSAKDGLLKAIRNLE